MIFADFNRDFSLDEMSCILTFSAIEKLLKFLKISYGNIKNSVIQKFKINRSSYI
jgi:hypothetical protein